MSNAVAVFLKRNKNYILSGDGYKHPRLFIISSDGEKQVLAWR